MTALHLNHKIPWSSILELFTIYQDSGIDLPIGDCGLIHLTTKKVQLQIENRKYLSEKICTNPECKVVGNKLFRKSEKKSYSFESFQRAMRRRISAEGNVGFPQLSHFCTCFANAITEFAASATKNVNCEKGSLTIHEVKSRLEASGKVFEKLFDCCHCDVFTTLIEMQDLKTLLSLQHRDVSKFVGCQHGGQAVGNNLNFLTFHILEVYLYTNLIMAMDLQGSPAKWGRMTPSSRHELMQDCDGQTFLDGSRGFLSDDVYLKDLDKTRRLCKNCFQYLYYVQILKTEYGLDNPDEGMIYYVRQCIDNL